MKHSFYYLFFFVISTIGAKIYIVETKDKHGNNHKQNTHIMYTKDNKHDTHKNKDTKHSDYQLDGYGYENASLTKPTSQKNDGWKDLELQYDRWKYIEEPVGDYKFSSKDSFRKQNKIANKRTGGKS